MKLAPRIQSFLLVLTFSFAFALNATAVIPAPPDASQQKLVAATTAARTAYVARDYATAERKYEEAVALAKSAGAKVRIVLLSNLGAVYREDHRYEQAEATFKRALEIAQVSGLERDQTAKLMMQQYAHLLRKMNKSIEADAMEIRAAGGAEPRQVSYGAEVARRPPKRAAAPSAAASRLPVDEVVDMSVEQLRAQLDKHPEQEILWAQLGVAYANDSKWKEAAEAFKRWLEITKTRQDKARYSLALALLKSGQPEPALEHCRRLVADEPDEGNNYRLLSSCYSQLGDMAAQLQVDEEYLEKFPNHPDHSAVAQTIPYLKKDIETTKNAAQNTANKPSDDELQRSWIKAQMPIKVFIKDRDDDSLNLPGDEANALTESTPGALLQRAMDEWAQASQGRISFVMADRIEEANITCEFTESPDGLENEFAAGITSWSNANPARPQAQIRLLTISRNTQKPIDRGRFYQTSLHEFGHALGLEHSNIASDIMYRKQRPQILIQLSDNDRDRLLKLYTAL